MYNHPISGFLNVNLSASSAKDYIICLIHIIFTYKYNVRPSVLGIRTTIYFYLHMIVQLLINIVQWIPLSSGLEC